MAGDLNEAMKKEETSLKVKIIGKSHVKPNKKIGTKHCQLVTFDLPYLAFYYNQKLLLYGDNGGEMKFPETVEKLKDGLETVLEPFHQLAGRLGKDEDGIFRVEYDDDMEGVEVAEAIADDVAIADLVAEEGTATLKELIPYNGILNLEGLQKPLLAVQVKKKKKNIFILV